MLLRKKEEIEAWLNQYKINNYELIKNEQYGYVVNVDSSINLNNKNLKSIDVKFNKINGHFDCSNNKLESLEGCPEIVKGSFFCSTNKLISLKYSPKIINGSFYCNSNQLESLEGCPNIVYGEFSCSFNKLESLKGCPEIIAGWLNCKNNNLKIEELKYLPKEIKKNYIDLEGNEELGDLQKIENFNELKEKVKIILEKENLLNIINKNELNINTKNSINKI